MNSRLKNVCIDKLDGIVNNYNNTYHRTIKMKSVDATKTHILTLSKKLLIRILNLTLVKLLQHQNIKIFMEKAKLEIGLKKFL